MRSVQALEWFKQKAVSRFWDSAHGQGMPATWAAEPRVRRQLNRRITGSPDVWPMDWFVRDVVPRVRLRTDGAPPFPRALSLGCGDGALERDLMSKQLCQEILGLDLSERALELARSSAKSEGWSGVSYAQVDLDRLQLEPESYEAVFVHQAMHHVRDLEGCLSQVYQALVPGGIFYLDEYIGPSRHEWRRELMISADQVYAQLPRRVRRRKRLQLPVDWRDPSEAVRSSEIVPLVDESFRLLESRDYGGNLLAIIYPHLRVEDLETAEKEELLDRLLEKEDELLDTDTPSFYAVLVFQKGDAAPANPGQGGD